MMNQQQVNILLRRLETFWPSIFRNNFEKQVAFAKFLEPHRYEDGARAVDQIVATKSQGIPTPADLISALPARAVQARVNDCRICDGTGWVNCPQLINGVAYDAVKDCECTPRPDEAKRSHVSVELSTRSRDVGDIGKIQDIMSKHNLVKKVDARG